MDKQIVIYQYNEILLGNKGNKFLIYPTMWINLKMIMLRERSQARKTTYCMILYIPNSRKAQIMIESRVVAKDH